MGLKSWLASLNKDVSGTPEPSNTLETGKNPCFVTPVTPQKSMELQQKSNLYRGGFSVVAPVTPQKVDEDAQNTEKSFISEKHHAANDSVQSRWLATDSTTAAVVFKQPPPITIGTTPTEKPLYWHETDAWRKGRDAYHAHHFACNWCIAAGRGNGSRCEAGEVLHQQYEVQAGPLDWYQQQPSV